MALPEIPLLDVGADWPTATLEAQLDRAHALLNESGARFPRLALGIADALSRRWLARWHEPYLAEIDRISALVGRPGAYFLNVSYEWGCTSSAGPSADGGSIVLMRVLDWPGPGLGRHIVAVRVDCPAGRWLTLTWPGYTGVLQAVAPDRFAAALNQAPMDSPLGTYALDWLVNRARVWKQPHLTAAHLLRRVFEQARDFAEAKAMLSETPIAFPTIYILAGSAPGQACVIERMQEMSHVIEGPASAVNAWQASHWSGHPRGKDNGRRLHLMETAAPSLDGAFPWLRPPVLNKWTRLVFVADAATGSVVAQGYEAEKPATRVLRALA